MPRIAISSGHSTKCQGAIGILNEVAEATKVVDRVHELLSKGGVQSWKFHDTTSTNSSDNLSRIVNWHNSQPTHDLDVSVHFNAFQSTSKPMGTECLYKTQSSLAAKVSAAQASAGTFINRGGKLRNDLYFLNQTRMPAILTEICFVDSAADAGLYEANFEKICQALAYALAPGMTIPGEPPVTEPPPVQVEQVVNVQIVAPPGVRVEVSINQESNELIGSTAD
jgi:N-acetylmuramoyl-L-alanine amidase